MVMSDTRKKQTCRIVPQGDFKCVWMTAGILSYQLCEREFECERCPLDLAMRMHFSRGEAAGTNAETVRVRSGLAGDRCYSRSHCWIQRGGVVGTATALHRVGLEPGLAAALLMPRTVVPPTAGETLRRGQAHLWIVTEGGTFALPSPLEGMVRTVNPRLAERPSTVTQSPMEAGWLYEVEVDDDAPSLAGLLDAPAAETRYAEDHRRFQAGLAKLLGEASAGVGSTLPDGGEPLEDVAQMLGPARYFDLLCKVYG
jgi:glycine cleavage system H protein